MPGITTGLYGKQSFKALAAHRLTLSQSAYIKFLFGEVPLEYLNSRLNKLIDEDCGDGSTRLRIITGFRDGD